MLERNSNNLDSSIKNRHTKQEEEKNFKKKLGFLSNTHQDFISNKKHGIDLHYLSNFQGFFNKNFNLTSFKQKQEDFRIKSRSPEKKINKHQIKGNGVPNDIIERMKFIGNIFNSERFQKLFRSINKLKSTDFEEISEKIQRFASKYSQLEGIMFSFYYICHTIKYDYNFMDKNLDYKKSQSIDSVMKHKRGLALGFTNLFEAFMKKLEVKCKHIEGYCKLMPDRVKYLSYNTDTNSSFNESNFRNKSKEKESNMRINTLKNTSIAFTRYNDSSIINNNIRYFGLSNTLSKLNLNDDFEEEDISDYINHCWNAIFYKGEWYLIDATLGSCWFDPIKVKKDNETSDEENEMQNVYKEDKDFY